MHVVIGWRQNTCDCHHDERFVGACAPPLLGSEINDQPRTLDSLDLDVKYAIIVGEGEVKSDPGHLVIAFQRPSLALEVPAGDLYGSLLSDPVGASLFWRSAYWGDLGPQRLQLTRLGLLKRRRPRWHLLEATGRKTIRDGIGPLCRVCWWTVCVFDPLCEVRRGCIMWESLDRRRHIDAACGYDGLICLTSNLDDRVLVVPPININLVTGYRLSESLVVAKVRLPGGFPAWSDVVNARMSREGHPVLGGVACRVEDNPGTRASVVERLTSSDSGCVVVGTLVPICVLGADGVVGGVDDEAARAV